MATSEKCVINHLERKYENGVWKGSKIDPPEGYFRYGERLLSAMRENESLIGQIDAITGIHDTFGDMAERSIRCALWMKKQYIQPGDIIGISTSSHLNSIIPIVSSLFIGSIFNPWWDASNDESLIQHFLDLTQVKVLFASETSAKLIQKVISKSQINLKIIVFGKMEGLESFDDIIAAQDSEEVINFKCTEIKSPDQPSMILYSSGTTGVPKGVLLSHKSIALCQAFIPKEFMGKSTGMNFSPLAWISGITNPLTAILSGSKLIMWYGISETDSFKFVNKYQVNWMTLNTGIANRMLKNSYFERHEFPSLKYLCVGGTRPNIRVIEFLKKTFPNAFVFQCYGLTDTGSNLLCVEPNHHPESCGKVIKNVEIKVVKTDGNEVLGPNEEGELYVKTPTMMLCYYKNSEATAAAFDDEGWFYTGDLGYYNEDGEFFITDRIKELIKCRGDYVPPTVIENCIQNYPEVSEVAVVAKPDYDGMELTMAFVVKNPGANVSENNIIDFVDKHLPKRYKLIGGVEFVNDLPRTASGKVMKRVLREIASQIASAELEYNNNTNIL